MLIFFQHYKQALFFAHIVTEYAVPCTGDIVRSCAQSAPAWHIHMSIASRYFTLIIYLIFSTPNKRLIHPTIKTSPPMGVMIPIPRSPTLLVILSTVNR